jgi:hypothetical protein
VAGVVAQAVEVDATQAALLAGIEPRAADLVAVYLPGLDIAQASLQDAGAAPASSLAERLRGLERVYVALDAIVGRLHLACPDHTVVLVAHPGRVPEPQDVQALMAIGWAGARPTDQGAAPLARTTTAAASGTLLDVAPTVLNLLGIPLSRELPGRWRPELVPAGFAAQHGPRFVLGYGGRQHAAQDLPSGARPLEDEMRERLRSLGYVQ